MTGRLALTRAHKDDGINCMLQAEIFEGKIFIMDCEVRRRRFERSISRSLCGRVIFLAVASRQLAFS
jgi:hypothetical protein